MLLTDMYAFVSISENNFICGASVECPLSVIFKIVACKLVQVSTD